MRKIKILDVLCFFLPSFLRKIVYILMGHKIGKEVKISIFALISGDEISIGDKSVIMPFTMIKASKIRIGQRSKIKVFSVIDTVDFSLGDDSVIMEQVLAGGMMTSRSQLHIGSRVKIFPFCFLNPTEPLNIEDDVGIGGASYIFTHGSWQSQLDGFPVAFAPVTIKKGVWFPWRVFVMPGVEVGEYSTIGASSVITKSIGPKSLAVGSPAKVIKQGDEYIKNYSNKEKAEILKGIAKDFVDFMSFKKHSVSFEKTDGKMVLNINSKKILFYTDEEWIDSAAEGFQIVFSLSSLEKSERKISMEWFDNQNHTSNESVSFEAKEFRNFLSRYGVRFEVIS